MRKLWIALTCAWVMQVIAAVPAHAWWEVVEGLSGPKLHGPHFEWRVLCFMGEADEATIRRYTPDPPEGKVAPVGLGLIGPCIHKVGAGSRKRFSIDFGARYLLDKSFEPAGGETVKFLSLEPVFTWYPIARPTSDVVDLSAGGGLYRFSSGAFPTFHGAFVEIPRVDVHVPTVIRRLSKWTFFIPTWRVGIMWFPSGFEANQFAAPGLTSKAMDFERGAYFGFFFDLEALCQPRDPRPNRFLRTICAD